MDDLMAEKAKKRHKYCKELNEDTCSNAAQQRVACLGLIRRRFCPSFTLKLTNQISFTRFLFLNLDL